MRLWANVQSNRAIEMAAVRRELIKTPGPANIEPTCQQNIFDMSILYAACVEESLVQASQVLGWPQSHSTVGSSVAIVYFAFRFF